MDARAALEALTEAASGAPVVEVRAFPPRRPRPQPFPDMPGILRERLELLGIAGLYPHQIAALETVVAKRNTVIATGTASGKTLVYDLAFAMDALRDPRSTALFLYPTKALARDQLKQVRALKLPQIKAAVYDGDTPQAERPLIRRNANLILSNPDMLHASLLPDHKRWADFMFRLSLVVVDEAHVARGVFGSHVAMILRRLRRLVSYYRGSPTFVLASATIGNPGELAERLTGLEFDVVDRDESPSGGKVFALWNPPVIDEESGARRSALTDGARIVGELAEQGARTIAFARSRRAAELLADFAKRGASPATRDRIKPYRAGYLPEQRREIERELVDGELLAVSTTNALELGIDVGSLEAAVMVGYPGTRASMWQQAGRAGRREGEALAVLVAQDDPLDQYLVTHPDDLFEAPAESAVVDPTNPFVLRPHLLCAAREQPLTEHDLAVFGPAGTGAAEALEAEGKLLRRNGILSATRKAPSHRDVDIRSASGDVFAIVIGDTGELLGTVDGSRAFVHTHPGAIYLHQGEQFEVQDLDLERRVAVVTASDADFYTRSRDVTDIRVASVTEDEAIGQTAIFYGDVHVTNQVTGFVRKSHRNGETTDSVALDLPAQTLETKSLWLSIPPAVIGRAGLIPSQIPGAAHAAEHAAIGMLPLIAICDRWDIGGVSTAFHEDTGACTIFIYDGYPGGAGIAERGFRHIDRLLSATLETVRTCECSHGCPSCVQSPKCGNGNEPLDKTGAVSMLRAILDR
jgi:DEAD/DEAH box helicase domain-containing protein